MPQLVSAVTIAGSYVGTPAGTKIGNTATLSYSINGANQAPISAAAIGVLVDEVIDPLMTCQNPNVAVNSPSTNDVLTYALHNWGNGNQTFGLSRINGPMPLPVGNYTPLNSAFYAPLNPAGATAAIFLESNGVPGFQAGADLAYVAGANDPVVPPGGSQLVYLVSDTPSVPLNSKGDVLLTATSLTAGAAGALKGARLVGKGANLGNGAGNALLATAGGASAATCSYVASGLGFAMNKVVLTSVDPTGGSVVMPGTIMTYQITVTLSGVGTAIGVIVNDPMPPNVTYVPGSIAVGGVVKTDAVDGDNAAFYAVAAAPVASANTVYVSLGNLVAPSTTVVTFKATVN